MLNKSELGTLPAMTQRPGDVSRFRASKLFSDVWDTLPDRKPTGNLPKGGDQKSGGVFRRLNLRAQALIAIFTRNLNAVDIEGRGIDWRQLTDEQLAEEARKALKDLKEHPGDSP